MLIPELELQALRFFNRDELEGLQMHSRYLRNLVNIHSQKLPLRHIHKVEISFGKCYIRRSEQHPQDHPLVLSVEYESDVLLHYVDNAFIHRLAFADRKMDLGFLRYMQEHADSLQCRIRTLNVDWSMFEFGVTPFDDALFDFIGTHLKPRVYESQLFPICRNAHIERELLLFARSSFSDKIKHVEYHLKDSLPAPSVIIPELFRSDALESCSMKVCVNPSNWLNDFVKTFEALTRGSMTVRSVVLFQPSFGDDSHMRPSVERFGLPHGDHVPVPKCAFVDERFRDRWAAHEITTTVPATAERFVFMNRVAAKKLQVLAWQIEEASSSWSAVHNAYLLEVSDL
ncbi:hypothetical protein AAVH_18200 [Aphelenchoides avenae]|nr:hypothetical protein AAVH_18200 [Aphelenchus avenae]